MDLTQLNVIARGEFKPTKKVSELEKGCNYMITKLKQVETRFGEKVVIELNEEFQLFLPAKVSTALIENQKLLDDMAANANKLKLFFTYKGGNCIEFNFV